MEKPTRRSQHGNLKPKQALKHGIRPENLRIRPEREVRVSLKLDRRTLGDALSKLNEFWFTCISTGAMLHRKFSADADIGPNFHWHEKGQLECQESHSNVFLDITQGRQMWAVQRTDEKGRKAFRLEATGVDGMALQVRLTRQSRLDVFTEIARAHQTATTLLENPGPNPSSMLCWIEARRREWLQRPDICRRVERNALPAFFFELQKVGYPQRFTVLNSLVKQTCQAKIAGIEQKDNMIQLKSPGVIFQWDQSRVDQAWVIRCGCSCGEEVVEMYDYRNRLIASVATQGITPAMARALPTLN